MVYKIVVKIEDKVVSKVVITIENKVVDKALVKEEVNKLVK